MDIRIEKYSNALRRSWSEVLSNAKNGILQFERDFIEYHGDRFVDASLLAFVDDRPVALLPAAINVDGVVTSHPGLTFGGFVLDRSLRSGTAFDIADAMFDFLRELGGKRCVMKLVPSALTTYPAEEIEYTLWRRGFKLCRRDLSSLLPLHDGIAFNSSKMQAFKKARNAGVEIGVESVAVFHALLHEVLQEQHGVAPVHSCAELELLQSRFPEQIFCRVAKLGSAVVAGALVFDYGRVWHTQYLASNGLSRDVGGLDLVIHELAQEAKSHDVDYLSFGTSTVEEGHAVNAGLLWQKESYGARSIVHDFYEGDL
jgi:hypothetical protein